MKITHRIVDNEIIKHGCDTSSCLLSNKAGSFLMLSSPPISKYDGLFISYRNDMIKIIEDIGILDGNITGIDNELDKIIRHHDRHTHNSETLKFPAGVNGIVYTLDSEAEVYIDFDCRKINDMRRFGLNYRIHSGKNDDDPLIIQFNKKTDKREDDTETQDEFSLFIAIKSDDFDAEKKYRFIDEWRENRYLYDSERGDYPDKRYVYRPFIIKTRRILLAAGKDKEESLNELRKLDSRIIEKKENMIHITGKDKYNLALACAVDSLEKLSLEHDNITRFYAGYPWFFQMWSRDENITLGASIAMRDFNTVKRIVFRYLENIGPDGRIPNRIPGSDLCSADGIGWLWKRTGDLIHKTARYGLLEKYINDSEFRKMTETLERSIELIEKNHMKDGLVINQAGETWMDTGWADKDMRDGACIEIQALHLNMLNLLSHIAKDSTTRKKYAKKEQDMKKNVLNRFWNGLMLADRASEFIARPNIFLAYYAYPQLLRKGAWHTCFQNTLEKIWLDWGGLSTIDKSHYLFTDHYTGRDNKSYHRGDSWFWINNIAALCLHRNDPSGFGKYIKKIINADVEEILWKGAIGHHAEVSSADCLGSKGCFAQAWSCATFIELIIEAFGGKKDLSR